MLLFNKVSTQHPDKLFSSEVDLLGNSFFKLKIFATSSDLRLGTLNIQGKNEDQDWQDYGNLVIDEFDYENSITIKKFPYEFIRVFYISTSGIGGELTAELIF